MVDTQLSSSIMGYWQKHEIQVEGILQQSKRQTKTIQIVSMSKKIFTSHGNLLKVALD